MSSSQDLIANKILEIWQDNTDGKNKESKKSFECKYCGKSFAKEKTLIAHSCEPKRRWQQEKEVGVQFGLRAFVLFYEMLQGKNPSYEDFARSPYYNAFVKFGRYLVNVRAIEADKYIRWLLKNNKKLDYWATDKMYEEWLPTHLQTENVQDALERGMTEMQKYAEDHPELKNGYMDYFRHVNSNRIMHHINTGKISPWVLYNCDSGVNFLSSLTEDQVAVIISIINPDFWSTKFAKYPEDQTWAKEILEAAGL